MNLPPVALQIWEAEAIMNTPAHHTNFVSKNQSLQPSQEKSKIQTTVWLAQPSIQERCCEKKEDVMRKKERKERRTHPQTSPSRNSAQSRSCTCSAAHLVGFGQAYKLGRGSIGSPSWLDCQLRARSRCVGWELGLGRRRNRRAGSGAGRSRLGSLRW